jgi:glycosyltransferase involved in cell wall biosynthesis
MKPHLVSVITPSYNQAEYIEECLLSVNNQDYPEIEHIVVDGGSEDGTINLLRGYEGRYNLNWVSEPDKGQSEAVNKGFLKAEGEIVGWINSDDVYLQSAVSSAVAHFSSQPDSKWVYGDAYWINQDGKVVNIYKSDNFSLKDLLLRGMYIPQPTIFFRKQVLETGQEIQG